MSGFVRRLPNLLTLARIALVAPILLLIFVDASWARPWALALFLIAAITDFFDGWIARRFQAGSDFGRMLDPIADKLLVAGLLLALAATGELMPYGGLVAALLIQLREVLVSGLREYGVSLPVTRLAKWKTTVQLVALAALLIRLQPVGAVLLWLASLLTVWTGLGYLRASLTPRPSR